MDFARRVDMRRVGKRPLEMLARAGAFDMIEESRGKVLKSLDGWVTWSSAVQEAGGLEPILAFRWRRGSAAAAPGAGADLAAGRKAGRGTCRRGLLPVRPSARRLSARAAPQGGPDPGRGDPQAAQDGALVAQLAGTVAHRQEKKSARGTRFAFVGLSDPTGLYEVTVFSDTLDAHRQHLEPGENVVLQVQVEPSGDQVKLLARGVTPLEQAVADAGANQLAVEITGLDAVPGIAAALARIQSEIRAPSRARRADRAAAEGWRRSGRYRDRRGRALDHPGATGPAGHPRRP
jgi:DNA polymerase-3 subunit alpha